MADAQQAGYAVAKLRNAAVTIQAPRETSSRKDWHLKLLESVDNAADSAGEAFTNLDKSAINFLTQTTKTCSIFQEAIQETTQGVAGSISGVTSGIQQFEQEALHDIQGWQAGLQKALEPIGLCSAIGDLTDLAKNPLGAPQYLANSLTSLVGKISPKFVEQADAAYKTLNLEGLSNLPSKMMGSIRSLATAADAILSVPFEIMSDVYNGLMEILDAIADLIDGLVTTIMNLAMSVVKALVDAIIPVDMILEFFAAVGDLASFVGDLAGLVGGFSAVTDITNQVSGFASLASGALNNPLGAALQFIPGAGDIVGQGLGAVSQVTGALRNPEQFLPSGIREQMQNISNIPGLGFVGNLGYSVGDTLDSLSEGVFSKALEQFSDKLPILNDAFNKPQEEPPAVDQQEGYSDEYQPQKVQGPVQHSTTQGIPHASNTSKVLLPENVQSAINQTNPTNNLVTPAAEKPWLNKNSLSNTGAGPTIQNAKNLKPPAPPTTYSIPGGTVSVPSSFSFNP